MSLERVLEALWSQHRAKSPDMLLPLWGKTSFGPLVPLAPGGIPRGPNL